MMPVGKKHRMTCQLCKKVIFDVVITKHMWAKHREHMMVGRRKRTEAERAARMGLPASFGKPYSMVSAHAGEKVDGRTAWGRTVHAERKHAVSNTLRFIEDKFVTSVLYEVLSVALGKQTKVEAFDKIAQIVAAQNADRFAKVVAL